MKPAYLNLIQEQAMHNCTVTPAFSETVTTYTCGNEGCTFKAEFAKTRFNMVSPHTCFTINYPQNADLMKEGDTIVLSFSFDEIFEVQLKSGQRYDARYGQFPHDSFINRPYGVKVQNNRNNGFVIPLRFQPVLHTEALKRRTQIIFTPDISLIVNKVGLRPGHTVIEAGIGSGSLSHAFLQAINPGKLYNFDLYQERVDQAQLEFANYSDNCTSQQSNVLVDGFKNVPNGVSDLVFLDLPSPELCLADVIRVSKPYSHFVIFLPCIEQIHQLCAEMYKNEHFGSVEVVKMNYNAFEFDNRTLGALQLYRGAKNVSDAKKFVQMRKVAVGRTHTGYLVFSRRKE
ncbi:tRNA_(adenine57-N1/adenine58-N1)-methyltransferase catalytic subunit [Hexamita inflata]|uniref:tRNA (adenine(58)-N(1))-methyltransferase n=1 Tax=Hexamita inflata TaxID=28002 RepID=A0ABP1I8L0_9EUKA